MQEKEREGGGGGSEKGVDRRANSPPPACLPACPPPRTLPIAKDGRAALRIRSPKLILHSLHDL